MITNREEIIDRAFGVFVRMNYEKASIITLARACGLTKTGIVYYFPHTPADTLAEFIGQYVAGVAASMKRILELIGDNHSPHDCCPNSYYFHFLSQVRMYYPGIRQKIERIFRLEYELWEKVIQKAKESGEIRSDTDVRKAATLFRQIFLGLSYEQAFLNGLDVDELEKNFRYVYSLLKA